MLKIITVIRQTANYSNTGVIKLTWYSVSGELSLEFEVSEESSDGDRLCGEDTELLFLIIWQQSLMRSKQLGDPGERK